ncbi:hypothetical protein DFH29DRAFT_935361, partial [Suillus ampliporus]
MYNTVKNSTELQYVIELRAPKLIPVHPRLPSISTTEYLRILRDKANTWTFFELNAIFLSHWWHIETFKSLTNQRLSSSTWVAGLDVIQIIDLKTCTPEIASAPPSILPSPHPVLSALSNCTRYIDRMQDLMIVILDLRHLLGYGVVHEIRFHKISTGEEHPLARRSSIMIGAGRVTYDEDFQFYVTEDALYEEDRYLHDIAFLTKERLLALTTH